MQTGAPVKSVKWLGLFSEFRRAG